MKLLDSRRLTGANLLLDGPAAVADVAAADAEADALIDAWHGKVAEALAAVGWGGAPVAHRRFAGGASLALSAPIDALYAAAEVNEWALAAAEAEVAGGAAMALEESVEALRRAIEGERNPKLLALRAKAIERGVAFLWDDDVASVGLGKGSQNWPANDLPDPEAVDWQAIHDVPVVLVTGTNGKSTTVRLTAAIVEGAGLVPGTSSTDWVCVGDEVLDTGDYSGPGGARAVLRDPRTDVAVLETARGGLLRRGLGVVRADGAAVLNVAEDHLGEWGIVDVAGLVEVKFLVTKALGRRGRLILNADEVPVLERGRRAAARKMWFSLDARHPELAQHFGAGGEGCFVEDGTVFLLRDGMHEAVMTETGIPITFGGRARFNTSNALAACCLAACAGLEPDAMAAGLEAFESSTYANPGRGNVFEIGGATVFADFAHNPHGTRALFEMARAYGARRTLVLLGQAGDRTDQDVRSLVEATWAGRPDRIVVKDMPEYLRGRAEGEMVALIDSELERVGVPAERIDHASSELQAVRQALAWSRAGDLLLLLLHAQRGEVLELLGGRREAEQRS